MFNQNVENSELQSESAQNQTAIPAANRQYGVMVYNPIGTAYMSVEPTLAQDSTAVSFEDHGPFPSNLPATILSSLIMDANLNEQNQNEQQVSNNRISSRLEPFLLGYHHPFIAGKQRLFGMNDERGRSFSPEYNGFRHQMISINNKPSEKMNMQRLVDMAMNSLIGQINQVAYHKELEAIA